MNKLKILWQFSRPHTIIGSTLSIIALYIIAINGSAFSIDHLLIVGISLLSAWGCNIYITGLNQWSDVDVDKVNKPWLPIASGELSRSTALVIVLICGGISMISAAYLSLPFLGLITSIMLIGTAYSLPPLKLKRSHLAAASAIALVRGVLINLGFYWHFQQTFLHQYEFNPFIGSLIIFVVAFSLGIAWFKDIPDTRGDEEYSFQTLAVKTGRTGAFRAGLLVVSLAYLSVIILAAISQIPAPIFMISSHAILWALFLFMAYRLDLTNDTSIKQFYMLFWGLFFIEYVVFALASCI
jgi:homogentisate phytyltransferase/homogentisate geranylgeranyltransferase